MTSLTIAKPIQQPPTVGVAEKQRPTEFTPIDVKLQRVLTTGHLGATVHKKFEAKYSQADGCFLVKGFNNEISKAPEQIKELATLTLWLKGAEIKPMNYEVDTSTGKLPPLVSKETREGHIDQNLKIFARPLDGSALVAPYYTTDSMGRNKTFSAFAPAYGFSINLDVIQGVQPVTQQQVQRVMKQAEHNHQMEHFDYIEAYRLKNNLPKQPQMTLLDVSKKEGHYGSPAHKEYASICSARTGGVIPASVFLEIEPYGGLAGSGPKVVGKENPSFGLTLSGGGGTALSKVGIAHDCDLCLARYFNIGPLVGKTGGTAPGDFKGTTGLNPFESDSYLAWGGRNDWRVKEIRPEVAEKNKLYTTEFLKLPEAEQKAVWAGVNARKE